MKKLIAVFFVTLLFSPPALCFDDYAFKYGLGLDNGQKTGQIKLFSFREESPIFRGIYSGAEGGVWVDNVDETRRGAAFGKYQLGVKPGAEVGLYGKAFWGVQLQSSADSQLGGYVQFSQDAGIGIRDNYTFIEAGYTHTSSAGIFKPNHGRDFLTLSLGISF